MSPILTIRGLAAVGLALACFALDAMPAPGQQGPPAVARTAAAADLDAEARHLAALRAERVAVFFHAWDDADEPRREVVRALLRDLRSPGAPAEVLPSLGAIDVATRVLRGEDPEALIGEHPAGVLAVQAMSLDLRVRPGVYRLPEPGGRAPSLVVEVVPLYDLRDAMDVDVTLWWVDPEGVEVEARRESVAAEAFRGDGFEMYVRGPRHPDADGLQLVAELTPRGDQDGDLLLTPARSTPVPVLTSLQEPADVYDRADLEPLVRRGLRVARGPYELPSTWLARGWGSQGIPGPVEPVRENEELAMRPMLLVAEPRVRAGGPTFAGPVGGAWWAAARELGHELATTYPLGSGETPRVSAACSAVAAERDVTLVLVGDAVLATQLEVLRHGAPQIDRLVVVANSWRPSPTLPAVPTLYLTPDAATAAFAGRAEHVTAEVLDDTIFLSGPAIPGRVATWLAGPGADDGAQDEAPDGAAGR